MNTSVQILSIHYSSIVRTFFQEGCCILVVDAV